MAVWRRCGDGRSCPSTVKGRCAQRWSMTSQHKSRKLKLVFIWVPKRMIYTSRLNGGLTANSLLTDSRLPFGILYIPNLNEWWSSLPWFAEGRVPTQSNLCSSEPFWDPRKGESIENWREGTSIDKAGNITRLYHQIQSPIDANWLISARYKKPQWTVSSVSHRWRGRFGIEQSFYFL